MVRTKTTPRRNIDAEESCRGRPKFGPRKMTPSEVIRRAKWRSLMFDYNPFTLRLKWIGKGPSPLGDNPVYDEKMVRIYQEKNKALLAQSEAEGKLQADRLLAIKVFGTDDMVFVNKMRQHYRQNKCRPSYVPLKDFRKEAFPAAE